MCKKNLEGKVLSPSSKNEDDILEETIVDNDITDKDDVDDTIVKPPKKKKRSSKKKKGQLYKYCKTCGEDILENERRDGFMYKDTYHQMLATNYCKEHETSHSDHKCKPNWCGDCGYLTNYQIEINEVQKGK